MRKSQKITTKLLQFIFSVSFVLVLGSFTIFYFYGKAYLIERSKTDLDIYTQLFEQATAAQLVEYNNNIDATFFETRTNNNNEFNENELLKNLYQGNENFFDQIYLSSSENNFVDIAKAIKVFGGKHIIDFRFMPKKEFQYFLDSIKMVSPLTASADLGNSYSNNLEEYFLIKKNREYLILVKMNSLNYFENIINKIYYSPNIDFSIIDKNKVAQFSTNEFWVNQRIDKYLTTEQISEGFYKEKDLSFVCVNSANKLFQGTLLITKNISSSFKSFTSIIYRLLFYSILIFLIISTFALIYMRKISKSLTKVSDVAKSIGEGDFGKKILINRNDELGMLISTFNKMVDNLEDSYTELNLTNNELEEKIKELIKTKNELTKQQKLALIGETISKISHEIQNKISGVSVWVQNLEMQPNLDENLKMYIDEIKDSLNSFIEMLLNFKKFYRKPYLEREEVQISELIRGIINNYCLDIEAKLIKIDLSLECEKSIFVDKYLLEEVIFNIIVNAIYFTPEYGTIKICNKCVNSQLLIIISDTGPGIKKENIENIFHPFFTTKSSGSGLGLAICKNIIEAHEGKIDVKTTMNKGTEFIITLPI